MPLSRSLTLLLLVAGLSLSVGCQKETPDGALADADIHYQAGLAYMAQGELTKARHELEIAISVKDDIADYYDALGLTHYYLGNYEIAEKRLLEAVRISSGLPQFYNNLANVYIRMERWDDAIRYAEMALEYPNYRTPAFAKFLIGIAHQGKGDIPKAVEMYREAKQEDPEFPNPYIKLADLFYEQNNCAEAFKNIRTAMTLLNQREPSALLLHGKIMLNCFDERLKAMESLLAVSDVAPESPMAEEANALLLTFKDIRRKQ